jgi:hypothetical protein
VKNNTYKENQQPGKVSFYIAAHADDWQLFMHPNVYNDIADADCKVIFIITTAGDAGLGEKFWKAREEGSKSSVRFCLAPLASLSESGGTRVFNDHPVNYWSINNTTSYFLRLPDGNLDGNGHEAAMYQSLTKFRSGKLGRITTIDNSATYNNWQELTGVMKCIVSYESGLLNNRRINYLNPDLSINPNDHPDHIATGFAVQQMNIIKTMQQFLFIGYSSCNGKERLSPTEFFQKAGMFAVYEKAVYDGCGYSTLMENADLYARWCFSRPQFTEIAATTSNLLSPQG